MNKVELLANIRSGRAQFESTLAPLSDDQLQAPQLHGGWSIKDVIAHLGFWEQDTALRFSALLRGAEPPDEGLTLDELNARVYAQNRHKSLAEVALKNKPPTSSCCCWWKTRWTMICSIRSALRGQKAGLLLTRL